MFKKLHTSLLALALVFFGFSLHAATYTWDGSVDYWNSSHWLPGSVNFPGAGHHMIINDGVSIISDPSSSYFPSTITLNGGELKITSTGALFPGASAPTQVITVNTGAVLELATWFKADSQSLGRLDQSAGRLILNGGTIRVTGVTGYGRGATVNAGGATLETAPGADWLLNQLTDDVPWTYNGNPTLIFTGSGIGRFEKAINSGTGSVIKRGSGKWTLSRTSSYSGDTVVEGGILVLRRSSLNDTSTVSIANGGILSLRHYDGDVVGRLVLNGVVMPTGTYNRSTHPRFFSGSGSLVIGGPSTSADPALTWHYGGGGDSAIRTQLTNSMNYCVDMYNDHAYLHGNIRAEYNSGVPTAQASFGGPITFGGSRNARVAMHEMGHVFGAGTRGEWGGNLSGGIWRGPVASRLIQQIDGPGAVINSDGTHFWPYGLNFDNEGGTRNEICHVRMMEAFMQDMGLYRGISTISPVSDFAIQTNSTIGPVNITIGDPGVSSGSLVFHVKSSNPSLIPDNRISVSGTGSSRTLNIAPIPGMAGSALITMMVSGGRDAAIETFAVTVGSFTWDGSSGAWDTTSSNWNNGTSTWPAFGSNNDAAFTGTGGVITIAGTIQADDLTFTGGNYLLTNGSIRFENTPAITVNQGVTATIASSLEGTPGIAKEGAGGLVLSGNSPYTGGIFVNGGTLLVRGNLSAAQVIEVRNGAFLSGSGAFPEVLIRSGGEFEPGPQHPAAITTRNLTLEGGSKVVLNLGVIGSKIHVNGDIALNGTLDIRASGYLINGVYTLITYTGTRSGNGLVLGTLPENYSAALDYSLPGEVRLWVSGGLDRKSAIAAGSTWNYNATGSNLGSGWTAQSYNDSAWPTGPAQIGYGDGDEATSLNTSVSRPQIVYFRRLFLLSAEDHANMAEAVLSLLRDDGAVVYLNGTEIRRDNMPASPAPILFNTPALTALGEPEERTYFDSTIPKNNFVIGTNLLAVEIHQSDPSSSDLSFDLQLDVIAPPEDGQTRYVSKSILSSGDIWRYFDRTTDLGTGWRATNYNDANWPSGPSMLGFGDADGINPATTIANNGQITTYFRRAIFIPNRDHIQSLSARIMRDDAAIIYLNGVELWRDPNLPSTGPIINSTPAQSALGGSDESEWMTVPIASSSLINGTNILAIEVHQNSSTSSDVAFDFELTAILQVPTDMHLSIDSTGISWPLGGEWLKLFSTTNLTPPITWTPVSIIPTLSTNGSLLSLPATTNKQTFYRLGF